MKSEARRVWERLRQWREHPITMAREEFHMEPDAWQAEVLEAFPHHQRLLMKACKGPGKTAVEAILGLNFLATRPHCRVGCTSITGDNLAQNLWPEFAVWLNRSAFCRETFTWSKTQIVHKQHPATWWAQARTWPKQADPQQQADALAGLHAPYVMWILDELGGYPQSIMTTAEAIFLSQAEEAKLLAAGNPTHTTGPLYRAVTQDRHLWYIVTITGDPDDPKRSPRIPIEHARQMIASHGRDNPWVMVNVLGQFPPASINALLSVNEVEAAMRRKLAPDLYNWAQKRIGVDVARFGDDRTVIFPRQGRKSWRPQVMRNAKTTQISARVAAAAAKWGAELILIDDTFQWGKGVLDQLGDAGFACQGVNYAAKAANPRFKNVRSAMWFDGAEHIKSGGVLPFMPELVPELTEITYTFSGGCFQLEPKELLKARIGLSPDLADAYMQTHAMPDMPGQLAGLLTRSSSAIIDRDPYPRRDEEGDREHGRTLIDNNPW